MESRLTGHGPGGTFTGKLKSFFRQGLKTSWRDEDAKDNPIETRPPENDMPSPRRATYHYEYMTPTLLEMAKSNPNLKLLDVGCGSGSITIELAKMIPNGQLTGLDISGAILESAEVHAERAGVSNITFVKGDVHDLPFPDGAFDVVHTHQAVAHFQDHARAIKELVRVTKKGGVVCMREGNLRTGKFSTGYELLDECFGVIAKVHEGNGGTADAGRRLRVWVEEAGIEKERIVKTESVWVYDTFEGRREYGGHWPARCTQGIFADRAMELGVTR